MFTSYQILSYFLPGASLLEKYPFSEIQNRKKLFSMVSRILVEIIVKFHKLFDFNHNQLSNEIFK